MGNKNNIQSRIVSSHFTNHDSDSMQSRDEKHALDFISFKLSQPSLDGIFDKIEGNNNGFYIVDMWNFNFFSFNLKETTVDIFWKRIFFSLFLSYLNAHFFSYRKK